MVIFGHKAPLTAVIGLFIIALNVVIAVAGPWLAPYSETQTVGKTWATISATSWLGTDQIGRDMLTRLIYGARLTIGIALVTTILSFAIGITLGLVAAVTGRWIDAVLSRTVDIVMSVPLLIWALIILSIFGQTLTSLVLTIAFLDSSRVYRLARALGMNLASLDFVEVARLRGEGIWWVVWREILPNAAAPLMSEFGLRFCFNFLFIAALSFIGLGVPLPYADWGGMVRDNITSLKLGRAAALYPAAAIALLTIGINLVVDWFLSIDARPSGAQAEM
ncbi:ABC transporter permease [Labrys sp. LIt4]|uniref:ABC transporter permease n=1 Tax=Labrys okinawensis TaxID=346911 RepID=A0A2S9Q4E9_9HYPH|nr:MULTISPECIES: ABC transporter permease [Labrys]MBP0582271.1 ABC transporter permease [Labrys sp. LIt4]PRH84190.1 ABC transporter permease [Labrys okinawensis]